MYRIRHCYLINMGSTGSLKYYQLSRLPKLKYFHTQVNKNGPQKSALLGDTSEARSQWPPGDGQSPPRTSAGLGSVRKSLFSVLQASSAIGK